MTGVDSFFASSMGVVEWEQREAFFGDGARGVARASKNCDDRSLALYSIFFRSLVTALGGRSELPGVRGLPRAQARLGHLLPHLPHEGGAMPSRGGKFPRGATGHTQVWAGDWRVNTLR